MGVSYYELIVDEKKDLSSIIKSKEYYNIVIDRYPNTDFALDAKFKLLLIDNILASKEIYLKAGDGLLFVDSLCHGSAKRTNKGERRIVVYRYGPSWGFFRHPYRPSKKLLSNLTEFQKKIVMPHEKVLSPNN